ncbi:type II toxin-antitoxin system RelE/ParE family toxin [Suttonella ornithocola]|uniref:Phage-related protein n=1 Tax=Suttonella ornithocola TaxID=279832 RepID=A0A380MLJ0_9GAMM|nr:type II toxin-antitoxin system RelE/ParE family toxin [Suttonella ornithocola]SUO93034.1 Phage-related protein [Suttonella ornithocola]
MKPITFLGSSLDDLRAFPADIKQRAGYELHKVQYGEMPTDFKPMPTIGKGVSEIRLKGENGAYRIIYTVKIGEHFYILHAFQKKTQKTAKVDIELAKNRLKQLIGGK